MARHEGRGGLKLDRRCGYASARPIVEAVSVGDAASLHTIIARELLSQRTDGLGPENAGDVLPGLFWVLERRMPVWIFVPFCLSGELGLENFTMMEGTGSQGLCNERAEH